MCCPEVVSEDASVLVIIDASPDMDTTAVVAKDLRGAFRVGLLFTASANAGQRDGSLLGDMAAESTESGWMCCPEVVSEDASVLVMVDASPDMDTTAVVAMDFRGAFRAGLLFTASANAGQRDGSLRGKWLRIQQSRDGCVVPKLFRRIQVYW